jgi:hypothetical protein
VPHATTPDGDLALSFGNVAMIEAQQDIEGFNEQIKPLGLLRKS